MIIPDLWRRLNYLIPSPECRTFGDEYDLTQWTDARTLPTESALMAVTEAVMIEDEILTEINSKLEVDKAFKLLFFINLDTENRIRVLEGKLEITQEVYKQALIDQYKAL